MNILSVCLCRLLGRVTDPEKAPPSQRTIALVQATGGIVAGATASCITTPLDTIKTRLQVFLGCRSKCMCLKLFF